MKRLDTALVELGLAPSRTKAQRLIEAGEVEVLVRGEWTPILQSSYALNEPSAVNVRVNDASPLLKYVSRGGLKLEAALAHLKLEVRDWRVLDVGISTGGFTDCLLQHGCREVIGVDVGHGQLASSLQTDRRVIVFEGVNARELEGHSALNAQLALGVDLCVVDVSFISLQLILPSLAKVLPAGTRLLTLVKPQFEVGAAHLDGQGIVRDTALFADVQAQILRALEKCGFSGVDYFPCAVKGQDGNQEFFAYSSRLA